MILVNKSNFSVSTLEKSRNSRTAPRDLHYTDFKICIVLAGSAVWEIEDQCHFVETGDIIFLKLGQKRHFASFGNTGLRLCVFTLTRNAFSDPRHFMFFLKCIQRQENVIKGSPLFPLLREIYEEWKPDAPFRYELASAKLTEFFIKAEKAAKDPFRPVSQDYYEMLELMDYIDSHITAGIRLQDAAQKAGMTESTFSRRFSAVNGISFKAYVVEKRLQYAIRLLQTTNKKMIDIALDSGFDSISGFYDAFKRKTGTTPNKFTDFDV